MGYYSNLHGSITLSDDSDNEKETVEAKQKIEEILKDTNLEFSLVSSKEKKGRASQRIS